MGGRAQCRGEREVRELEERDETFLGSPACYISRQVRDVVVIRNALGSNPSSRFAICTGGGRRITSFTA
jgi:hypothetical protein